MKISSIYLILLLLSCSAVAQESPLLSKIDSEVRDLMHEGNIPGLSIVVVQNGQSMVRTYGYQDAEKKRAVTANTLFQIASCSKAFTALAVLQLVQEQKIDPDSYVSDYLPWFTVQYEGRPVNITVRQLLHHTSGIPWETVSSIPATSAFDALEQTVRRLVNIELDHLPGEAYKYATTNYDVLALIIQTVTGQSFESYLQQQVLDKLGLQHTTVGVPLDSNLMSVGYKIGFFRARAYDAPVYKGNNAAGYVISNARDMATWLQFQMGLTGSELYPLAQQSHQRDETVAPWGLSSYAMGWQVSISGNGEIRHSGTNPNFTSHIAFRPKKKIGVVVLANSNSTFTPVIGDRIIKMLAGEKIEKQFNPDNGNDTIFSVISIILGCYTLFMMGFLFVTARDIIKNRRPLQAFTRPRMARLASSLLFVLPVLYGIYLFPTVLGFTWEAVTVWTPSSFITMIVLLVAAIGISFFTFLLSSLFPGEYSVKKQIPRIILISIVSGLANMALILLITSSLKDTVDLKYLSFYYGIAILIYILGRKYVQTKLIRITRELIYDIRVRLIEKIFSTSYQKFEKIDRGRIYATLNDDAGAVGDSATMIVNLVTSFITAGGAFLYLATIAFWTTLLTIALITAISIMYFHVGKSTNRFFEEARDTRNVFMRLLNGLIDGFKEISLHRNKKIEYKNDVAHTAHEYKEKTTTANVRFVNAHVVGECSLILMLGLVSFGIPRLFPGIELYVITSFVIVLLYLNGPLNTILTSVPSIMQLKIAWNRIQSFINEIPANLDLNKIPQTIPHSEVQSIKTQGLSFRYENDEGKECFAIGPVDLEVEKGQALFIIGGNGSGKTTLAKLITGLYEPDKGKILINDKEVDSTQLSEYFSAVFSPCHLFQKLYNIDLKGRSQEVKKYLKLLGLTDKVEIDQHQYNTLNLSGGQRKRLALLQCYLEDSPIYLFDEWTADQDPQYRRFFYRELLPEMKQRGKIVIAITHDDHYFDVADKILKMDLGRVEYVSNDFRVDSVLSN
ncbi:MAG TPA: cyclic peptide export ABC transporter [Chitinophagaceae bacterium]|nr:cyclic peptide export ABC transporter [Chitinophagaceae bacterium]